MVLKYDAQVLPIERHLPRGELTYIDIVNQYSASRWQIKQQQQLQERTFPCPRMPSYKRHRPFGEFYRNVFQRLRAIIEAFSDVMELDPRH
jgi:hypothetical protein